MELIETCDRRGRGVVDVVFALKPMLRISPSKTWQNDPNVRPFWPALSLAPLSPSTTGASNRHTEL
jgi:hypothetical protein